MYKRYSITKRKRKMLKALAMTRRLLLWLANDSGGVSSKGIFSPFSYWQGDWTLEDELYAQKAQAKRAFYELKRKKFIETRKQGDKIMYRLTEKGKMAALKDRVRAAEDRRDGKILIVSFDIPEQEKHIRAKLRYYLKDNLFEYLQDSVWSTRRDVGQLFAGLIQDIGASKWVRIFEAKEL